MAGPGITTYGIAPQRKLIDASFIADGLSFFVSTKLQASLTGKYGTKVTSLAVVYQLDPPGADLTLIEGSGSPKFASILMPEDVAASYLINYQQGGVWSAAEAASPGDTITFPTSGVDGIRVQSFGANGQLVPSDTEFSFNVTFASAGQFTGTVAPTPAPTITGTKAGQATVAEKAVSPFSGVTITDPSATATDTLTIALAGGGGTLSGAGLTAKPDGTYTLTGTAKAITAAVKALTFTPTAGAPGSSTTTTFTLTDVGGNSAVMTNSTTTVIDKAAAATPTITGIQAGQMTSAEAPVSPFSGVTIDDGNIGATETLTIALSGTGGTLSGSGLKGSGSSYTL